MRLGIIGLPQGGKTTIFEALTGMAGRKGENRLSSVKVPDPRLESLSRMFQPRKETPAQVDYFMPAGLKGNRKEDMFWAPVRNCDAFLQIIRNFHSGGSVPSDPEADFWKLQQEMILADLLVIEKRIERLEMEKNRGRPVPEDEYRLLRTARNHLENNQPLRSDAALFSSPYLRGYAFLTARRVLAVLNNDDDDTSLPRDLTETADCVVVRGRLELEIARMNEEDLPAFMNEYHITEPAVHRVIRRSYDLLGLISFFTVGEDECRAWTVPENTTALDAAEVIHSDIKKGFIRAEVVSFSSFIETGSYAAARKAGVVRLEGKTYIVQDGDIIDFRFNV